MNQDVEFSRNRVAIIAELSANHGGSLQRAIDTIGAAAEAGADAVKIQTYTPDMLTMDCDREEFMIRGGPWDGRTLYDLYREAHTPLEWHATLFDAARRAGIPLFSTPFDPAAVELLEGLSAPMYKIASFELTDLELLRHVAACRKPMIVSTGMATVGEIDDAVRTIREVWAGHDPGLWLLKCVSAYPAQAVDMNLATIPELGRVFGARPGLSDHTLGTAVAVASVALGARLIEKHFTLRRADGGPDSAFSIEPAELKRLVEDVRTAEAAIGTVRFGRSEAEHASVRFRRSIFVVGEVKQGDQLTRENVRVIRPGYGLPPRMLPDVLGRRAAQDIRRGTPLRLELLV